jgi:hypothetical protein
LHPAPGFLPVFLKTQAVLEPADGTTGCHYS